MDPKYLVEKEKKGVLIRQIGHVSYHLGSLLGAIAYAKQNILMLLELG